MKSGKWKCGKVEWKSGKVGMWGNRYVGKRVTGKENEKKWERKRKSGKWEFGTLGKWENGKWKVKRGKWENG